MSAHTAGTGLRVVLVCDIVTHVLFWGLPGLFASGTLAEFWGITLPGGLDTTYVRVLGAFALSWGLLYLAALRKVTQNLDIVRVGIVTHCLVGVTILFVLLSGDVIPVLTASLHTHRFWWVTVSLNGVFAVSLLGFLPSGEGDGGGVSSG